VLEIDEHVAAVCCLPSYDVGPALDVRRLVPLVAESEVCIVRRNAKRRRQFRAISDAEREISSMKALEDVLLQPRGVAEFERRA
jgi:hypothetical protein